MTMRFAKLAFGGLLLAAVATPARAADDDPYLWLEDIHGAKPMEWVKQQNEKSLGVLKSDPAYQKDYDAILKVLDATDRIPFGDVDHGFVFNFWQDAEHPKGIWRRTTVADYANPAPNWDVLLDLDKLAADEHENWVWKGYECTPSLEQCLVDLSRGGGDAVVVREFDPDKKAFQTVQNDGFFLPEAKSTATYLDENRVLFATDFGKGTLTQSGYPRIVKLWQRGMPLEKSRQIFEGDVKDVASQPVVFWGAQGATALVVRATDFFHTEYYYVQRSGEPTKLPLPLGADVKGAIGRNLILTLREDWNFEDTGYGKGSLLAYELEPGVERAPPAAVEFLANPGGHTTVDQVEVGRDAVYASVYDDVKGSVHVYRFNPGSVGDGTWSDTKLHLPAGGATSIVSANSWGPQAQFRFESYTQPTTLYAYGGEGEPKAIKSLPARFDASNMATEQFFATSKDGTKIPYFVTRQKNIAGPAPTVLYGYGGFEISETPTYSANFGMLWLTHGGVYVVANIRGGGEYGPAWHQAALLQNRQKAYDDFQAVAEDLIRRGITTPKQLGIMGGSNGGLLVSANMVERPDLFGAVVCQVPLVDMIRYTKIGAGASWAAEYGDPDDPKARAWILKYSPYQNVKPDVKMPPVLFVTATSDDRVTPVHARKMAAKMEAEGHDVLFYENTDGGHAAAANHRQAAEMWALSFVYLARELGLGNAAAH
jgi:prolyl oligopeptidase